MTEDEFQTRVFEMLWNLTETYQSGGPSCVDVSERITALSREVDHNDNSG